MVLIDLNSNNNDLREWNIYSRASNMEYLWNYIISMQDVILLDYRLVHLLPHESRPR